MPSNIDMASASGSVAAEFAAWQSEAVCSDKQHVGSQAGTQTDIATTESDTSILINRRIALHYHPVRFPSCLFLTIYG